MTVQVVRYRDYTDDQRRLVIGVIDVYIDGVERRLMVKYFEPGPAEPYPFTLWGRLPDDSIRDCNELFVLDEDG